MIEQLTQPILQIIATSIIGALVLILVILNKTVATWFIDNIWAKISYEYKHGKIKKHEIEKDTKIREILIELRAIVGSDRTSLFQYHNGNVFTTKNPIWKVSNTHESIATGISSEIGNLQDIKASCIIETLKTLWESSSLGSGIENIAPEYCTGCSTECKLDEHRKRIIFIDVNKLEDCYSKSLLVKQGIHYVIDVPIFNGSNCVGFVAVSYCKEVDIEKIKSTAYDICKISSQIEFLLVS